MLCCVTRRRLKGECVVKCVKGFASLANWRLTPQREWCKVMFRSRGIAGVSTRFDATDYVTPVAEWL